MCGSNTTVYSERTIALLYENEERKPIIITVIKLTDIQQNLFWLALVNKN